MTAPFLLMLMFAQQGGASSPAEAVASLQEAIRLSPEVESNYTDLGNVLLRTQNFKEAVMVLEITRRKFPSSAQAALSLGVAWYGLRRFADAVGAFLDAGRLDPAAEQPIAFLTRLPENWGEKKEQVIALFTEYSRSHPQSALGHFALGSATRDAAEIQKSIDLNPRNPEAFIELGSIREAGREFPAAIKAFIQASKLAPKNPIPHYRLSRLYARTGDTARAEAERILHEKLSAEEKAALDRRQAATPHLQLSVQP